MTLFELSKVLKHRFKKKLYISKPISGDSIVTHPAEVRGRNTFGHREGDMVLSRKVSGEPVIFMLVAQLTGCCVFLRVGGRSTPNIIHAIKGLSQQHTVVSLFTSHPSKHGEARWFLPPIWHGNAGSMNASTVFSVSISPRQNLSLYQ